MKLTKVYKVKVFERKQWLNRHTETLKEAAEMSFGESFSEPTKQCTSHITKKKSCKTFCRIFEEFKRRRRTSKNEKQIGYFRF